MHLRSMHGPQGGAVSAAAKRLEFDDVGPDHLGRRRFTLFWLSDGAHGTLDPATGLRNRAQCFFTDPAPYIAQGFTPTTKAS